MATPAQRLMDDRLKYPGMAPREVLIYKVWLATHGGEYDRFEYNVHVGKGTDPGAPFPDVYRQQYIFNTQKRIDVVGWKGEQPTIIEVKDRATGSSMSQILTYKALWPVTFPNTPAPLLLLVTNRVSADMPMVLDATGIRLEQVGEVDFSSLRSRVPNILPPTGI
jgi:hypothetical protein